MVLRMIELGYPLDEVLCCDTTMEFPAMYRHIEKVKRVVEAAGIKFTTLRAEHDFEYYMLHHKPKWKNPEMIGRLGYSWPSSHIRWCTSRMKVDIIDKYLRKLRRRYIVQQYVGIAADEGERLKRENNRSKGHRHPLVEWGWTEAEAMRYCREKGYDWEGLYELFNRVSCWCCPLQPLSELRKLRTHFPELWSYLQELDGNTWRKFRPDYSAHDLDKRFELEEALTAAGEKVRNRRFFSDLRRCLQEGVGIEEIIAERMQKEGDSEPRNSPAKQNHRCPM